LCIFKVLRYCFFYFIVHPVRLSLVFIKGYLTCLDLTLNQLYTLESFIFIHQTFGKRLCLILTRFSWKLIVSEYSVIRTENNVSNLLSYLSIGHPF